MEPQLRHGFAALEPPHRLACGGVLLAVAAADGVVDEEELLPILADLDLATLGPDRVERLAAWLVHPPSIDEVVADLADAPAAVRFGLVARMLEIAGADGFLGPGELERVAHAAHALRIDDDQLGGLRVFVAEMAQAGAREPGDPQRVRRIGAAGFGLALVGVPWGAVTYCDAVAALGPEADLLGPAFGFPPGISLAALLGSPPERARAEARAAERVRSGLELVTVALDAVPDPAVAIWKRVLGRRLKSLAPG